MREFDVVSELAKAFMQASVFANHFELWEKVKLILDLVQPLSEVVKNRALSPDFSHHVAGFLNDSLELFEDRVYAKSLAVAVNAVIAELAFIADA